jgi:hypothetical protein
MVVWPDPRIRILRVRRFRHGKTTFNCFAPGVAHHRPHRHSTLHPQIHRCVLLTLYLFIESMAVYPGIVRVLHSCKSEQASYTPGYGYYQWICWVSVDVWYVYLYSISPPFDTGVRLIAVLKLDVAIFARSVIYSFEPWYVCILAPDTRIASVIGVPSNPCDP